MNGDIRTAARRDPRPYWRRLWRPHATGPNFFSTSFSQPLGAHIDADDIHGYYLDLRVKAASPGWPPRWLVEPERTMWVSVVQLGLGSYERHIAGEGDEWLETALGVGEYLLRRQETGGSARGAWLHHFPLSHTYVLRTPWASAIAQGQAASLLVRLFRLTGDERYATAARDALAPMRRASDLPGGVRARLGGLPFFEEYPTDPPSFVFNGFVFGLWGCRDVAVAIDDASARELLEEGLEGLAASIAHFDTGYWSRYDLYPHRLVNVASLAYHELHVDQLRATALVTGGAAFNDAADRFAEYRSGWPNVARAMTRKIAFRLLVPRRFD
jgi:hypothetical protein